MINVQVQIANLIIENWTLKKRRFANSACGYLTFDVHLFPVQSDLGFWLKEE